MPPSPTSVLRSFFVRGRRILASERRAFARTGSIRPDVVVYESFAGNGALCNPEAIFRALLDDPSFAHLTHVWALADEESAAPMRSEFAAHPRVTIVRRGGGAYWRAVSTAGFLINNATFPPEFGKRPGQIYLNTWHGTPLKLMGFDMPGGATESANTLRNFLSADYLLAANPFMSEVMYENAYRLRNVFDGEIIEEGYPRIDRQYLTESERAAVREDLSRALGRDLQGRRIVLFAPTWRGASFQKPDAELAHLAGEVQRIQAELGDDTVVLIKTHQVVHSLAANIPSLRRLLVPNTLPTNVALGIADALITDYSSIFFDFLATGRPIAFLVPDRAAYEAERGTYVPLDELPGPVSSDATALGRHLADLLSPGAAPHERYVEWATRFTPYEDGGATQRVIDIVFRGQRADRRVRRAARDGRQRVLFYLGGMKLNGITTAAVNLLNALDPERYDVTALMALPRGETTRANQQRLGGSIRQIFRIGGMNGLKSRQVLRRLADVSSDPMRTYRRIGHRSLWRDEWHRIFGSARFDWVADFSGYSPFWAHLMLYSPPTTRAIWLHNEMTADRERNVGGRYPFRRSLGRVFAMYRSYDQLVSVSPSLTDLNRRELAGFAAPEAFRTLRNLPDLVPDEADAPAAENPEDAPWRSALDLPEVTRFVTVGRLSTEKNHARLIRAFARIHAENRQTQLFLVGGGPLAESLRRQIEDAGLTEAVFLTGPLSDPLAVMRRCDCFVLSSDYEGQPMVLIEAAQLGMPIVTTRFGSAPGALPGDPLLIVERDDPHLAEGMRAFLRGEVAPATLDVDSYTADVRAQFDELVGVQDHR